MSDFAEPLTRLVEELSQLPGIGARTAERLAFHLLNAEREPAMRLARAIRDVKDSLHACSICGNVTDQDTCSICRSENRDRSRICVVEHVKDLIAIEKTGAYDGLYHVLQGKVSPQRGKSPADITLGQLVARVERAGKEGDALEVILATNPDAEGEATALVVREQLSPYGASITRLARGIPAGGSIEFANVEILRDAFRGRANDVE